MDRKAAIWVVWCALGLGVAGACQRQSVGELVAQHRTAVEATFGSIQKLVSVVKRAPRQVASKLDHPGERVVLEPDSEQNAAVIYEEDLADPGSQRLVSFRTRRADDLAECGTLVRTHKTLGGMANPHPRFVRDKLQACGRLKYLFVIETETARSPSVRDEKTFSPGKFVGTVHLYRIADQRHFGGFRVTAESSYSVTLTGKDVDSHRVEADIRANVFVAIDDAIRQHVPSALPSPKPPK